MKKDCKNAFVLTGILMSAIGLSSCGGNDVRDADYMVFSPFKVAASFKLDASASDFGMPDDVIFTDRISLIMPERLGNADVETLRDSILSCAFGKKHTSMDSAADHYMKERVGNYGYEVDRLDKACNIDVSHGYELIDGSIVNLTTDMLVYCVSVSSYDPGAAHGMSVSRYINFYMSDGGRILSLNDIFTPEGLGKLPARIREQAESRAEVLGDTDVTSLPADGNFYLSSEGEIVMAYQPYEVSPYASGSIEVPFYPYELSDYMTPFGLKIFNLEDLHE